MGSTVAGDNDVSRVRPGQAVRANPLRRGVVPHLHPGQVHARVGAAGQDVRIMRPDTAVLLRPLGAAGMPAVPPAGAPSASVPAGEAVLGVWAAAQAGAQSW